MNKLKYKPVISVILAILLVCFVVIAGCAGVKQRMVANMMREMPENTVYFSFWDIEALRGDSDLINAYQGWQYNYQYTFDDYGIVTDNVNRTVLGMSAEDEGFYIIYGDFDLNEMKVKRDSLGFDADLYLDVEVWKRTGELVALMDGLIIAGTEQGVKDCIEVIKQDKESLWDNQDIKDVVNMLPCGFNISYGGPNMLSYKGEKAYGLSWEKKDRGTLKITNVFMFENIDAAHNVLDLMEEEVEDEGFEYTDIKQDGEFVISIIEVDIDLMYPQS